MTTSDTVYSLQIWSRVNHFRSTARIKQTFIMEDENVMKKLLWPLNAKTNSNYCEKGHSECSDIAAVQKVTFECYNVNTCLAKPEPKPQPNPIYTVTTKNILWECYLTS